MSDSPFLRTVGSVRRGKRNGVKEIRATVRLGVFGSPAEDGFAARTAALPGNCRAQGHHPDMNY